MKMEPRPTTVLLDIVIDSILKHGWGRLTTVKDGHPCCLAGHVCYNILNLKEQSDLLDALRDYFLKYYHSQGKLLDVVWIGVATINDSYIKDQNELLGHLRRMKASYHV